MREVADRVEQLPPFGREAAADQSGDLFVRVRAKSGRLPREGVYVSADDLMQASATVTAASSGTASGDRPAARPARKSTPSTPAES